MKRFYKDVSIALAEGGFCVLLDGKPVKTPGRNALLLPTAALAGAIAAEWQSQGEAIVATSMPLLRLAKMAALAAASNPSTSAVGSASA